MNINWHFSESIYFNKESNSSKTLWIVITSNKWLCWGYNINVMKKVNEYIKSNWNDIDFISLWKRWSQFLARTWNNIVADFSDHFTDNINFIFSKSVSRMILEKFSTWNYKNVVVFYNYYVNTIRQIPMSREFLPLTDESIEKYFTDILWDSFKLQDEADIETDYIVEPSLPELLEEIVPMLVDAMFFDVLIESKASEHSSRMIAMKNAKDNANKFASKLVLQYNKARQAAITKEISEIVSWVESMKE